MRAPTEQTPPVAHPHFLSVGTDGGEAAARRRPLASCEVWIGSSESNPADSSRLDDLDEAALLRRDGIGVVYIPLAANEARVPGFDPSVVSTWRREVTAEESQALLDVAEVNASLFSHGSGLERKKKTRVLNERLLCRQTLRTAERRLSGCFGRYGCGRSTRGPAPSGENVSGGFITIYGTTVAFEQRGGHTMIHLLFIHSHTRANCVHRSGGK